MGALSWIRSLCVQALTGFFVSSCRQQRVPGAYKSATQITLDVREFWSDPRKNTGEFQRERFGQTPREVCWCEFQRNVFGIAVSVFRQAGMGQCNNINIWIYLVFGGIRNLSLIILQSILSDTSHFATCAFSYIFIQCEKPIRNKKWNLKF